MERRRDDGAALPRAFLTAFNAHDAATLASGFSEDADYIDFSGNWYRGRTAIEDAHARVFAGPLGSASMECTELDAATVTSDVLRFVMKWTLNGQRDEQGSLTPARHGCIIFLAVKTESGWSLRTGQNTEETSVPGYGV